MCSEATSSGTDCPSPLDHLSCKGETYSYSRYSKGTTALPRIVDGVLLVRKQLVLQVRPLEDMPSPSNLGSFICPQLRWDWRYTAGKSGDIIQHLLELWDKQESFETPGGSMQCKFRAVDFRIDFKDFGEQRVSVFFTRWQNLGEGRSPQDHL